MPNQVESYQKVLEIVTDDNFNQDAKAILIQIAKSHPQVVVEAFASLKGAPVNRYGVSQAVMDALTAGQKIQAIKQHRRDTGLGLKEAKDAVDHVITNDSRLWSLFGRLSGGCSPYP